MACPSGGVTPRTDRLQPGSRPFKSTSDFRVAPCLGRLENWRKQSLRGKSTCAINAAAIGLHGGFPMVLVRENELGSSCRLRMEGGQV